MEKNKQELNLQSIIARNMDIDDADLDGEKVMMNLDKGQYFMMNEVGSRIWECIEKDTSIIDIVNTLLNEYEVEEATCKETVLKFLGRLEDEGLITVR